MKKNFSLLKPAALALLLHLGSASAQVTLLSNNWLFHQGSGSSHIPNDANSSYNYFSGAASHDTVDGFQFEAAGQPFTFQSVDLYSSVTTVPYEFVGTLGSQVVFTATGTAQGNNGLFLTVFNPYSSLAIDKLVVQLTNPASFMDGNPVGFKSIVTTAATVPEPASLALLGIGVTTVLIRRKSAAASRG